MSIDPTTLRTFIAAVEGRSLAQAAAREGLVTSAVSKRIAELERTLGITVLTRHNRGVEPTAAGLDLYHRALSILRQMDSLTSITEDYASDGRSKIQLVANRSAIILFLPKDIALFQSQQSHKVRIDLLEAYSGDIPRLVVEKNLDIGIYHATGPAPGVYSLPYYQDNVTLVVPNGHPLQARESVRLDDVRKYDFLGYFPRHSYESFMQLAGHSLTGPLNVRIQVSNYEARCRMIREGLGIGIMPEGIANTYLQQFGLTKIALEDSWAKRQFYLCVRDPETQRDTSRALFEFFATRTSNKKI
ncbi:LysR family transcriptional regulator [Orrella sp. 11846]|uniref:LysR family transcriptional regulator n=1 Tax=Orrella sp. 11846 TaxID=3409913 RepID=UPI003B5A997D